MELNLNSVDLDSVINNGLQINIQGCKGNIASDENEVIFLEYHDNEFKLHLWNGTEDPLSIKLECSPYLWSRKDK